MKVGSVAIVWRKVPRMNLETNCTTETTLNIK